MNIKILVAAHKTYWMPEDPVKPNRELDWKAECDLLTMCRDSWNWQKRNPEGFEG